MSEQLETSNGVADDINNLDENGQPKSAKQLKKEAEKAAKLLKLQQKLEKKTAPPVNKEKEVYFTEFQKVYKSI